MLPINFPIDSVIIAAISAPEKANKDPIVLFMCIYCSKKVYKLGSVELNPAPNMMHAYNRNIKASVLLLFQLKIEA
jgi:hypothetical protein